jgi:peptide/nickel transport system permease protein
MLRFISQRILWGVFTMWAISVLTFMIIQLPPGDFASTYVARVTQSGGASINVETLRDQLGLDQSIAQQYYHWIGRVLQGDFGQSLYLNRPVIDIIGGDILFTAVVAFSAIIITWVIALPIGVYSAVNRYSAGDYILTILGFLGLAIPNFLLALVLMYFGFSFFDMSVGGLLSPEYQTAPWSFGKVLDLLSHLVIPAVVMGAAGMAHLMRIMRANLLDELGKPYVVTAQAKGLSKWRVITRYPVRVALNPFASSIGLLLPQVISGTIIVSIVLSLPTLGPRLLDALRAQDMFLAGAIVLILGALTVVGTLISDIVLMLIDPRIRYAR